MHCEMVLKGQSLLKGASAGYIDRNKAEQTMNEAGRAQASSEAAAFVCSEDVVRS